MIQRSSKVAPQFQKEKLLTEFQQARQLLSKVMGVWPLPSKALKAWLSPPRQGCPNFWHLWATLEEEELPWDIVIL